MAKLAVFFLVIFVIVQLTWCDEAADTADIDANAETTSAPGILDNIKKGIENGLSPENIDKIKTDFGTFANSVQELGNKFGEKVKGFFDRSTTEAPAADA